MPSWFQNIKSGATGSNKTSSWANNIVGGAGSSLSSIVQSSGDSVGSTQSAKVSVNIDASSSPYSATSQSNQIIFVDSSSSAITINLPSASSVASGSEITIKDKSGSASTNSITVSAGTGTIDGLSSVVLENDYSALLIYSDGSQWLLS